MNYISFFAALIFLAIQAPVPVLMIKEAADQHDTDRDEQKNYYIVHAMILWYSTCFVEIPDYKSIDPVWKLLQRALNFVSTNWNFPGLSLIKNLDVMLGAILPELKDNIWCIFWIKINAGVFTCFVFKVIVNDAGQIGHFQSV